MKAYKFSISFFSLCPTFRNDFNVVHFYRHRLIRIVPNLLVTIVIMTMVVENIQNGPLFNDEHWVAKEGNCQKNWWKPLLFIQNYASPTEMVRLYYILRQVTSKFLAVLATYLVTLCRYAAFPHITNFPIRILEIRLQVFPILFCVNCRIIVVCLRKSS